MPAATASKAATLSAIFSGSPPTTPIPPCPAYLAANRRLGLRSCPVYIGGCFRWWSVRA
jgi:hypothetical protein